MNRVRLIQLKFSGRHPANCRNNYRRHSSTLLDWVQGTRFLAHVDSVIVTQKPADPSFGRNLESGKQLSNEGDQREVHKATEPFQRLPYLWAATFIRPIVRVSDPPLGSHRFSLESPAVNPLPRSTRCQSIVSGSWSLSDTRPKGRSPRISPPVSVVTTIDKKRFPVKVAFLDLDPCSGRPTSILPQLRSFGQSRTHSAASATLSPLFWTVSQHFD
ncbi:hypothetical protein BKA67DRAFT_223430 [Truncatella angustata]|uniref:Uncharacterized protein n=1 Tax=Truncatella angustata TaxID=152316 RepID=A0A9P8ZZH2_9PEZI|nr:uncharacterized protein BKA67DRAFT_223430 [Truncatella angustata]KAH6655014.1 hypothetical protein BKA67DRAFT_223430 [Truncatella angustata]